MDDKKKKRLAALKAETAENVTKPPRKQKEKLDLWDEINLNRNVIADKPRTVVTPTPIATDPIPNVAVIAPTISPRAEPLQQEPIAPPTEQTKIYRWPDGYYP